MRFISKSKKETQKAGAEFSRKIVGAALRGRPDEGQPHRVAPTVIGLSGDLGSGKTTFVQGMARGLGIDPDYYVNSPTFTLVNEYVVGACDNTPVHLIHVDLYRIAKPGEAEMLALEEYIRPGNIVVIEWAERLPGFLQGLDFEVRFGVISDTAREIEIL